MTPAQPFQDYLSYRLLDQGKRLDVKTCEAYGRRLWDFARFLAANDLTWNQPFASHGQSVVRAYRDWQAHDLKLEASTINDRLQIVTDLYQWALDRQLIDRLPFGRTDVTVHGIQGDLAHISGGTRTFSRSSVLLDEWEKEPAFLTIEELKLARNSIRSSSQRLLFDLMSRVGLRSVEARTFPRAYVFDPSTHASMRAGTLIEVRLDPRDMEIKFDKPRIVHMPYSLMEDMHSYVNFERNRVATRTSAKELILTTSGRRYSKGSAVKVFSDLSDRVGFRIRPLMLRHSYAIHTLLLLRGHPEIKLEPLMYVRDRLGHRSVQTTMVYLSQIERLMGDQVLSIMQEFDRLYDVSFPTSSPPDA